MIYKKEGNATVFLDDLPQDLQAEGLAIQIAVLTGKCRECRYQARCCRDTNFKFPDDAFCMKRKKAILTEWDKEEHAKDA